MQTSLSPTIPSTGKEFEQDTLTALSTLDFELEPRITSRAGDDGLDLVGCWRDNNNNKQSVLVPHVVVQCKLKLDLVNGEGVGVEALRELESSLSRWSTLKNIPLGNTLGGISTNSRFSGPLKVWFEASPINLFLVRVTDRRVSTMSFNPAARTRFDILSTTQWMPKVGMSRNVLMVAKRLFLF